MARVDFKNKVVLVTGASSGIGAELTKQLNAMGAVVIASARRMDRIEELKNQCVNPENIVSIELDLTDQSSIDSIVSELKKMDKLDLVIHNAGIAQKGLVIENDLEVDRKVMETNYFGTISLTKKILPIFRKQGHGWFAVVTSLAGAVGVPGRSAYSASKHALHGFFESLRAENFDCDLDVSVIMPGFIHTDITVKALKGDGSEYGKVEKSHKQGMSAEKCAQRIIHGLRKRKKNIVVGHLEILIVYIQRLSPSLYNFVVRNHPIKRWRAFLRFLGFGRRRSKTA
jgi:short-subunit dehydrogenase